ncbi:hypothetical protein ACEPAF_9060 [Sanghuangporus sanghuang]
MFSKQLISTLTLLVFVASSALAAPPLSCPAVSTVTVVASSAAVSNIAVSSSAVISSAAVSATSTSSSKGGKGSKESKDGKDKDGKGKGGKNKGGNSSASASAVASSTDSIFVSASATDSIAASATGVSSSAASATASLVVGGGEKGVGGSSLTSSVVASATASASSGAASGSATDDQQAATTLNPAVIATGFASDGQQVPTAGQVPSLTSTNNFINFCLTVNKPITNGQQIKTGSCNPAPIGVIAATTNMPSSKFQFPKNNDTIPANQAFTIKMAINNLETGNFVNANSNYYSAPQQVNAQGNIIGHSHVVIELLDSLSQTTLTDPNKFAFFKGINGAAVNGVVTADVTAGLPAGAYRMASINAAANHQPVLVAVAQHGSLDDMVYFTVQ